MVFLVRSESWRPLISPKLLVSALIAVLMVILISWFHLEQASSNFLTSTKLGKTYLDPDNGKFLDWVKFKPEMDDPQFLQFVRKNYMIPPSNEPYSLSPGVAEDPSDGHVPVLMPLFPKTPGFFIECGGHDGEHLSNTLYLEKEFGWTGIIIEAEPKHFEQLRSKNRKAWIVPACLSMEKYPVSTTWYRNKNGWDGNGLVNHKMMLKEKSSTLTLHCIPLYSLLLNLNKTVIDFFSLDVEGAELKILKTVPFDKIIFKVLILEVGFGETPQEIKEYMASIGYVYLGFFSTSASFDLMFKHESTKGALAPSPKVNATY